MDPDAPLDRVLVTGATGFLGGHLAERLLADGVAVRCLVRPGRSAGALRQAGAEIARGALGDPGALRVAATGCTHVVHAAAMVSDWGTVAEILAANVAGTAALLEAARAAGVRRFVHVSSTDVLGYPGVLAAETAAPPGPLRNWYAETKRRAEALVLAAASGPPERVIVRPATIWGPRSTAVVGEIATALRGGYMLLVGGGHARAGLVYVDNVVDGLRLALGHPDAPGGTFALSDGLGVTWRRFTDDLAAGLGVRGARLSLPYPVALALGTGLERGYRGLRGATGLTLPALLSRQAVQVTGIDQDFRTDRARARLGWLPRVGYEAGLAATLAWLRAPGA